jgi:hypothetical protein
LTLPVGSTANGTTPTPEPTYLLGWNASGNGLQNIDPADLLTVAGSGGFVYRIRSGDGSTTIFSLVDSPPTASNPGTLGNLEVFISGVRQTPGSDYVVYGSTSVQFTSAPPAGTDNILIRWGQTYPVSVVSYGSVSPDKLTQPYTLVSPASTLPGGWNFSIPDWAKRITVLFENIALSGSASDIFINIGPSAGVESTGYYSGSEKWSGFSGVSSTGFILKYSSSYPFYGKMTIDKVSDFKYVASHSCHIVNPPSSIWLVRGSGHKSLTSALRTLSISTPVDTFTSGTIALSYE